MLIELIKEKKEIEVCSSDRIPQSIQLEDVVEMTKRLERKKSLQEFSSEDEKLVEKWKEVFSNRIALGLSFRKNAPIFDTEFLKESADFDWIALDSLVELCTNCIPFKRALSEALVREFSNKIAEDERIRVAHRTRRQNTVRD